MHNSARYFLNRRFANILTILTKLSRAQRRVIQLTFDTSALVLSACLAVQLTSDNGFTHSHGISVAFAPLAGIPFFIRFGLYRAVLRYMSDKIVWTVARAVGLAAIVWGLIALLLASIYAHEASYLQPAIFGVFAFTITLISRFAGKHLISLDDSKGKKRCAIYGAGAGGLQYFNALIASGTTDVVALFDDDNTLYGREIHGVRILPPTQIKDYIENLGITSIVICMPSVSNRRRSEIAASLSQYPVKVMILPSIPELFDSKYRIEPFDDVDINELLSRTPVPPDRQLMKSTAKGKVVLVSGAGGSVGSQLVESLAENDVASIIMLDHSEHALFELQRRLDKEKFKCALLPVLGSVLDAALLDRIFKEHKPTVVFHAAAYKHVAIAEKNPASTFRNNVLGTRQLLNSSKAGGADQFVFITTDKAVNPTSVMGATKRIAELLVSSFAKTVKKDQVFISVRFGNVIGSQGSVIPIFKEQIRSGGPVTVRGRDTTRYFMSISEACGLIIQAAGLAKGGETFMLNMGKPVVIYNLARNMIELSGLTVRDEINPNGDIEIAITQIGPGEKVFEDLMDEQTTYLETPHPKIFLAKDQSEASAKITEVIDQIDEQIAGISVSAARDLIMTNVEDSQGISSRKKVGN